MKITIDHALKIDNRHGEDVLTSLTYMSRNNEQKSCIELTRILEKSLRNNEKNEITSALIINEKYFIQTIERSRPKINQLVIKLINDHRHFAINLVNTQEIEQRRWEGFSMKYLTQNVKDEYCILKHFSATADFNPYLMEKDRIKDFIDSIFENTEARAHRKPELELELD